VLFRRALPSGPGVGALGVDPFAAALLGMAFGAHALQLRWPIIIRLGLDVVAVGRRSHATQHASHVPRELLRPDLPPTIRKS
jgi:hypothetical protein